MMPEGSVFSHTMYLQVVFVVHVCTTSRCDYVANA